MKTFEQSASKSASRSLEAPIAIPLATRLDSVEILKRSQVEGKLDHTLQNEHHAQFVRRLFSKKFTEIEGRESRAAHDLEQCEAERARIRSAFSLSQTLAADRAALVKKLEEGAQSHADESGWDRVRASERLEMQRDYESWQKRLYRELDALDQRIAQFVQESGIQLPSEE